MASVIQKLLKLLHEEPFNAGIIHHLPPPPQENYPHWTSTYLNDEENFF